MSVLLLASQIGVTHLLLFSIPEWNRLFLDGCQQRAGRNAFVYGQQPSVGAAIGVPANCLCLTRRGHQLQMTWSCYMRARERYLIELTLGILKRGHHLFSSLVSRIVGSDVPAAVTIQSSILWSVPPCSPVKISRYFGKTCCSKSKPSK